MNNSAARGATADVIVIGAGVIGLAVARQLRLGGVARVTVLERLSSPGLGSSSRANGGVRAQFSTNLNIQFSKRTIAEFSQLQERFDLVGLRQVGYLFLTGSATVAAGLHRSQVLQRNNGIDAVWLSPDEVASQYPFARSEGLLGAAFCSTDGVVDPAGVISALWAECRRLGVEIRFDSPVVGVSPTSPATVRTAGIWMESEFVVNAAGPYAAEVAALGGVELPVLPVRRNLAFARAPMGLPETIPMCVDADTGVLVRREGPAGLLIAYSDPSDESSWETTLDPRFLGQLAERVGNRFPFLEEAPIDIRQCWAGLYPETPDHQAVIDSPPAFPNFIQCAGFGGHGIMHSIAAGVAVAELITLGKCESFDLDAFRIGRFADGQLQFETAVL